MKKNARNEEVFVGIREKKIVRKKWAQMQNDLFC